MINILLYLFTMAFLTKSQKCMSNSYFPQVLGGTQGDTSFTVIDMDAATNPIVGGYTFD